MSVSQMTYELLELRDIVSSSNKCGGSVDVENVTCATIARSFVPKGASGEAAVPSKMVDYALALQLPARNPRAPPPYRHLPAARVAPTPS